MTRVGLALPPRVVRDRRSRIGYNAPMHRSLVLAVLPCAVLACGGAIALSSDGGPDDGSTDGTLAHDASALNDGGGPDGTAAACPASSPLIAVACSPVGEECEYGSAWWLSCENVMKCGTDGQWTQSVHGTGLCGTEDAGSCPATYAAALDAGVCAVGDCDYPEGHCSCLGYCGGPPPPGPVPKTFHCSPKPPGCPTPRPHGGTACATEGQVCAYTLGCCGGTVLECKSGVWAAKQPPVCP